MSATCPTISVVIPFHRAMFFRECIGSVLVQTYRPFEIIVVNDGAKSADAEILEEFSRRACIIHQTNHGPGAARNVGVSVASGEWIAFLDDDDVWDPKRLEMLTEYINTHLNCNAVYNSYRIIDTERVSSARDLSLNDLLNSYPSPVKSSSVVLRKTTLMQAGLMNCTLPLCVDFECFVRIATLTNFCGVDVPLTGRRKHAGNISGQLRLKYRFRNRLLNLYQDRYRSKAEHRRFALRMNCRFLEQCIARRDISGVREIFRLAGGNGVSAIWLLTELVRRIFVKS